VVKNFGAAKLANKPIITITKINSIKVNPFFIGILSDLFIGYYNTYLF
jgi:hypothetical protein